MDLIILGFLIAVGKYTLFTKLFTLRKLLYFEKYVELFFAVVMPLLFIGTFHGAVLAALSGVWLTLFLRVSGLFVTPVMPDWVARLKGTRR